jgi:hypothetical protein
VTVDPLADLLAARLIRRAIGDQSAFVPACDPLIDGCFGGEHGWHRGVLDDVHRLPATAATGSLRAALEAALDAAFAAETSLDFSPPRRRARRRPCPRSARRPRAARPAPLHDARVPDRPPRPRDGAPP